jgi:hypothetical protein
MLDIYGLSNLTVRLKFSDHNSGTAPLSVVQTLFAIKYSVRYKTANIFYSPLTLESFAKKDFDILMQGLTHELAHPITEKMATLSESRCVTKSELDDEIESLTETVAGLGRKILLLQK